MAMSHSVFAMELCFRIEPGSPLQGHLREALYKLPAAMSAHEKWEYYRWVSEMLVNHLSFADAGCWDFWDTDSKAQSDFKMWCDGLFTEEGGRKTPSGPPAPFRGDVRYMTFTVALLLQYGSYTERGMSRLCNIAEANLWQRATFAHILRGIRSISFASVKGDVVYLLPRDADWGLTAEDLRQPKFEYLRPLS